MNEVEHQGERVLDYVQGKLTAAELVGLSPAELTKLTQLGVSAYSAGLHDRAQRVFELFAAVQPDLYIPHHYLGMIHARRKDAPQAVAAYQRAGTLLESMPARSAEQTGILHDIALQLSSVLLEQGAFDAAKTYLDELDALDDLAPHIRANVNAYLGMLASYAAGTDRVEA